MMMRRTSDNFGRSAGIYKAPRFEWRTSTIGEHSSRSPVEWQAGVWQPPKSNHLFPASHRVGIRFVPSDSCWSTQRRRWARAAATAPTRMHTRETRGQPARAAARGPQRAAATSRSGGARD